MLKRIFLLFVLLATALSVGHAKTLEMEVFAKSEDVTSELTEFDLLTLNGIRLAVTNELEILKLDSSLFWKKLEDKKLTPADELKYLKPIFQDIVVNRNVAGTDTNAPLKAETKVEKQSKDESPKALLPKISGTWKANLESEQLKSLYDQVINDLEETKKKTFYILADIAIDSSMNWEDLGVTKPLNFSGVIIDSWKKLVLKDFKSFENVTVLEKDFSSKPDYMNTKSVTLKWNSIFKKSSVNEQKKTATYELSAQYLLVNTKSGTILLSLDFPVQKRELDVLNKKALSSALASLVYNLLLSQSQKIQDALLAQGTTELTHMELKIASGAGLSEVYAINSLVQEKLKEFKATSSVKSYSSGGETLIQVEAGASADQILEKLSLEGGKFPLNEQKVLLFNAASKSFAIIPKDSNN